MPWGYVCGYPTTAHGDLYGGAHYVDSSAGTTPQGRAIKQAAIDFGNGYTLPFTPCKKGYSPIRKTDGRALAACPLHNRAREMRLQKEEGVFRAGEVNLEQVFWSKVVETTTTAGDGDKKVAAKKKKP